jgi:NAD(P)-dependent dehydrogenase (short-subunit alcohol dehydrogenase family)
VGLAGRVALVTGSGRGIGAEAARKLAEAGAYLALADLDLGAAEETAAAMRKAGHRAVAAKVDVLEPASVRDMVARVVEQFGRLDILVNNVGGGSGTHSFDETTLEVWDRNIALNLRSVFLCCKEAVPHMKAGGWGRIVNVASLAGRSRALTGGPEYAASKAGVIGFTRHLSGELAPYGILVNAVAPALAATPRVRANFEKLPPEQQARLLAAVPVGRWARPEEVAAAVAFLCSEEASYICGAVLDVNGGSFVG